MILISPMDALSFNLGFDTASLAHCDAVRGERHPPHLWLCNWKLGPQKLALPSLGPIDIGKPHLGVNAQRSVVGDERHENRARLDPVIKDAPAGKVLQEGGRF